MRRSIPLPKWMLPKKSKMLVSVYMEDNVLHVDVLKRRFGFINYNEHFTFKMTDGRFK